MPKIDSETFPFNISDLFPNIYTGDTTLRLSVSKKLL
uniref:Uncharacterized protein n=1 Tax=virus sp. ctML55 TaxID=2827627 RepID=A0A8S5RIV0_9VIRU|nr:MAG TPA: hypothetical protein [virus sp. ctML55]